MAEKIDVSKISEIRRKCGLETDSKSRWAFLVRKGLSPNEATHKIFEEKGLIKGNKINEKRVQKCKIKW